jgi:hypothetical protein
MTILAIDLVFSSVHHMGKLDGLVGLIVLLPAQSCTCLIEQLRLPSDRHHKQDQQDQTPFHLLEEKHIQHDPGKQGSQQNEQEDLIDDGLLLGQSGGFKFVQIQA